LARRRRTPPWQAYDLLHELATEDGGVLGLRALDVLRAVNVERR
jgi:hypothetical protein